MSDDLRRPPAPDADEIRGLCATLLHDVGKYVARVARNVGDRPITGPLAEMLLRDVYETYRGSRASARFDELARALCDRGFRDPRLDRAREILGSIDGHETKARAGEVAALAAIARGALEVESLLREIARERQGR